MKLLNKRIFRSMRATHRSTYRCLKCIGHTFNGSQICTGCLDNVPIPECMQARAALVKPAVPHNFDDFGRPQTAAEEKRDDETIAIWMAIKNGGGVYIDEVQKKTKLDFGVVKKHMDYLHKKEMVKVKSNMWYAIPAKKERKCAI